MNRPLSPRARPLLISAGAAALALASAYIVDSRPALAADQPPLLLQAEEYDFDSATGIVSARGNVEVNDQGRTLHADSVTYNQNTGVIGAEGNVSVTEPDGTVAFADRVELSGDLREGALQGFAALIGETGRLAASSATRTGGRYTEARGAIFTPCELCEEAGTTPVWQIKAARLIHDQVAKELTFEAARLEVLGTPVLYLPSLTLPDPTVRHQSGLLVPVIGSSTYLGTFVQVPYYFSLSPSRDLTVQPYITTEAGDVLMGEYRQRWERGGMWLQGSLGYDSAGPTLSPGDSEWMSHLFGAGRMPIDGIWRTGFDVQVASNDTYLRRYDISYLDRLTSDLFVDGVSGRSRAAATAFYFQSLRPGESPGETPFVFPLAEVTYIPEDKIYGGRLRMDSSGLVLVRPDGTDMVRASTSGDWLRQFITANGQLISADVFARGDLYHVMDVRASPLARPDDQTIGRAVGFAALEWRWPFVSAAGNGDATLVIEPIAQLVAATGGGNPPGIPNEDLTTFEFDETNLFIPNEFPGLDLWTGGPRSNAGVRATAFFPNGASIEGMLGEEFRTRRDPNFAPGSGVGDERSDIVGRIKVHFAPYLDLVHRFRIDPATSTLRRNEIYLTASYGRSSLDFSYLKLSPETTDPSLGAREQINLSGVFSLYGNWGLFAQGRYDLRSGRTLEGGGGLRYEDECFMVQLGFLRRETSDRDLRPATSAVIKIGLKTGLSSGGGF